MVRSCSQHWLGLFALLIMSPWVTAAPVTDAATQATLHRLYQENTAAHQLATQAKGILVFPELVKTGLGVSGEHGVGQLLINGQPHGQYTLSSAASYGVQLGSQQKSIVLMFMTQQGLKQLLHSPVWDPEAHHELGLPQMTSATMQAEVKQPPTHKPIIGFIFSDKGMLYARSLAHTQIKPQPEIHPSTVSSTPSQITGDNAKSPAPHHTPAVSGTPDPRAVLHLQPPHSTQVGGQAR